MRSKTTCVEERILDGAARLFGSQRFHEVRMEDIAGEAEVGKGTIYRYFSDKDELYSALVARSSKQFLQKLQGIFDQTDQPREQLTGVVAGIIAFFDERPQLFDLIQRAEVLQGAGFPWRDARDELFRRVTEVFVEGKKQGDFDLVDPELAALMLLGGLRTLIRFGKRPRPEGIARRVVCVFLREACTADKPKPAKETIRR